MYQAIVLLPLIGALCAGFFGRTREESVELVEVETGRGLS
jgi:hypothetical protein